jgi:hypothetical protein
LHIAKNPLLRRVAPAGVAPHLGFPTQPFDRIVEHRDPLAAEGLDCDYGPGVEDSEENQGLGTQILNGLAVQIRGRLTIAHDHGTTVAVG